MNTEIVLNSLDLSIIVGSLTLIFLVGIWASRNPDQSARGYFLASGKLPWYLIGTSFVATSVSSEQIVGTVWAAYAHGMGIANWEWFILPVYTLLLVFFIPVYLKSRITTIPELLTARFSPLCGNIYSWVMVLAYVFVFMVPVLYGGSLLFSELFGWNQYLLIWGIVVLTGAYTVKGGLRSVMWTDAMQCLLLIGGGLILFFVALGKIPGGWSAMMAADPVDMPRWAHLYRPADDPQAPFLGLLCGTIGVFIFYQAANQVMVQRVLGARSTWDGMMGIIFAAFINLVRPLVTCFLGLIVFYWIHEMRQAQPLSNADTAFPFALKHLAPEWGLRGIVCAGFLAAVMSTISSLVNSTATLFSIDVYGKLIKKNATDREMVTVGKLAALVALASAGILAPAVERFGGIFNYFQTCVTSIATPFIAVILCGLLWKRTNNQGGVFGLVAGLVIVFSVFFGFPALGWEFHWFYLGFIAQVIIIVGVVVVSLLTPPPDPSKWEPFLWRPQLLTQYDEGFRRPWYKSLKLWYGLFAAIWLFLYWRFW